VEGARRFGVGACGAGRRERELANIYRGYDAARRLSDEDFAAVLAFVKTGFEMAVDFRSGRSSAVRAPADGQIARKRGSRNLTFEAGNTMLVTQCFARRPSTTHAMTEISPPAAKLPASNSRGAGIRS